MRGDSRGKDNTALDACFRCQAEVFHESREYLLAIDDVPTRATQVPRSCQRRLMPGATWSIRGQGRLWRILPREAALPQIESSSCQRPRVSDIMMATPTAPSSRSRRGFRSACEQQETQAPGRDRDQCSGLENLERVGIHWCENNLAGAKRLQSCAAQHAVSHKARPQEE